MVINKNNFIIEADDDLDYVLDIVSYLEQNMKPIMDFFGLESLSTKKKIIIYKDLDKYIKHIEEFFKYEDHMCADTNDGNINILSLEAAHKTKMYKDMTLEKLKSVILHEFVHVCQQEKQVEINDDDIIWFWEGLATNLGNPEEYKCIPITATDDDINDFNSSDSNYPIAYTIGRYLLENYSHEEIIEYVEYPSKLLTDSKRILNEAREWSKETKRIIK